MNIRAQLARVLELPDIPTGHEKPSWAGVFGAIPAVYIFWDPYRLGAGWLEWTLTSAAFAIFLALFLLASIYWSRPRIMQRVCIAMAILAILFTAYRPSGATFFIYVAVFAPLATGGDISRSIAAIAVVALAVLLEWRLRWPPSWLPYIVVIEAAVFGGSILLVVRQQIGMRAILKTAERERIARDLHDILGHTLTVITLKAELAARLLRHDPERARAEIEEVERTSRKALADVREAIAGYRGADLKAEFERAQAVLESAGIAVERHCEELQLPAAQERVLALVVREAITNVIRHAQANRCRMTLERADGMYRLEIHDNGRAGNLTEGMGMRGIRERIAAIGGTVCWTASLGTVMTISIPDTVRVE